jgi:hypothetical protein
MSVYSTLSSSFLSYGGIFTDGIVRSGGSLSLPYDQTSRCGHHQDGTYIRHCLLLLLSYSLCLENIFVYLFIWVDGCIQKIRGSIHGGTVRHNDIDIGSVGTLALHATLPIVEVTHSIPRRNPVGGWSIHHTTTHSLSSLPASFLPFRLSYLSMDPSRSNRIFTAG